MSKVIKGKLAEQQASKEIHRTGVPLLISSRVLRSYGAGQVDVARFIAKDCVEIWEIKAHERGVGKKQIHRLRKSAGLLAQIFSCTVKIRIS